MRFWYLSVALSSIEDSDEAAQTSQNLRCSHKYSLDVDENPDKRFDL